MANLTIVSVPNAERSRIVGKKGLEFGQRVTADQAAGFLEETAKGLRCGTIEVSAGGRTIRLSPTSIVKLELEVWGDDDKQELSVEMKWHLPELRAVAADPGLAVNSTPVDSTDSGSDLE